ncbi:serine/threonine-protein kinase/endoribonuclease IRE1a [Cannabis sativa]|uniref:serine/threonine-protein kinase/endoribonuclease IRE1a n=1 Tax=Cannabis sativa TaxID=3483 RepID=UPI0029CA570D|nr:serine/threonine-protein kinase/endoribonuclease IRE1a [Cannabis sativa]
MHQPRVISEKLTYFPERKIGQESHGGIAFEGSYEGRSVAIKRLQQANVKLVRKEIESLIKSDEHENIVRYYGVEQDLDFFYIALQRGTCNLDDFVKLCGDENNKDDPKRNLFGDDDIKPLTKHGRPTQFLLTLLSDIVEGVKYLHKLNIIHRNLKPQDILIFKGPGRVRAKISDMAITKLLPHNIYSITNSSTGCDAKDWQPAERLVPGQHISTAVDMFSIGCIFSFCITDGRSHPFDTHDGRELHLNIIENKMDLKFLSHFPEAEDLISKLISNDPKSRPTAADVSIHPMLWKSDTRISFIYQTNIKAREDLNSTFSQALNNINIGIINSNWENILDDLIKKDMQTRIQQRCNYNVSSILDLLRLQRNLFNHNKEKKILYQDWKWAECEDLESYFANTFPRLFIEMYKIIFQYHKQDEDFKKYFDESHNL